MTINVYGFGDYFNLLGEPVVSYRIRLSAAKTLLEFVNVRITNLRKQEKHLTLERLQKSQAESRVKRGELDLARRHLEAYTAALNIVREWVRDTNQCKQFVNIAKELLSEEQFTAIQSKVCIQPVKLDADVKSKFLQVFNTPENEFSYKIANHLNLSEESATQLFSGIENSEQPSRDVAKLFDEYAAIAKGK